MCRTGWCERNTKLWNSGIEANKDIVSKHRKRQTKFVANIYVIQDPKNPEAEGKTFLFTFGPKILDKIKACSVKEFPDSVPFNPFDLWKGANFRLKIKNDKYGQRNYDASSFDKPEPLSTDDSLLEKIWESEYGLTESFLVKSQFKTYVELEKRLNDVLVETETSEQSPAPRTAKVQEKKEPEPTTDGGSSTSSKYQEFLNKFKDEDSEKDEEDLF